MELAHALDNGLIRLLVARKPEAGVLLGQFHEGHAHLLVIRLRLGLHRDLNDRFRELHALEHRRGRGVAQGLAGDGILEADDGDDIARAGLVDLLALVRVHEKHAADPLLLALHGVEHGRALLHDARVNADEGEGADERIGDDLEREARERRHVVGLADEGVAVDVHALDGGDVERGGHVVDEGVEEGLDALVLEGGAAENGGEVEADGALADAGFELGLGDLLALEVHGENVVVDLDGGFDEHLAVLLGLLKHIGGDVLVVVGGAEGLFLPDDGLHADEIDNALELGLGADGELEDEGDCAQILLDHVHAVVEVRAGAVHLVREAHARDAVLVGLAPHSFGLGLDAGDGVEDGDGAVQDAEGTLDLEGEVDVARGVDNVDTSVLPESRGGGSGDGDAALLLLGHIVHGGGAVVDLADFVGLAGVVEDTLGGGGLAGVDVGHDANVAVVLQVVDEVGAIVDVAFVHGGRDAGAAAGDGGVRGGDCEGAGEGGGAERAGAGIVAGGDGAAGGGGVERKGGSGRDEGGHGGELGR
mmetsp:Transcript_16906/g.45368  ORF Transcript_16906/g.45368 Transcript_16906/m.45368 type:complete len:533 (+) Transcript_16906:948-2546(+)